MPINSLADPNNGERIFVEIKLMDGTGTVRSRKLDGIVTVWLRWVIKNERFTVTTYLLYLNSNYANASANANANDD